MLQKGCTGSLHQINNVNSLNGVNGLDTSSGVYKGCKVEMLFCLSLLDHPASHQMFEQVVLKLGI